MNKTLAAVVTIAAVVALSACEVEDPEATTGSNDTAASSAPSAKADNKPKATTAQRNAVKSAEQYLSMGTGFSRAGLIEQLSSEMGSGFARRDAVYAVNHVDVNWNEQAVLAAKAYMDMGTGFSRNGLIEQLSSAAGSQFTKAQAVYAANKVGL